MGIIQVLVSDYECGKLRPHPEMLARFAKALLVSADEILGLKSSQIANRGPHNRLRAFDGLPERDQDALLRTIDAFLTKTSR